MFEKLRIKTNQANDAYKAHKEREEAFHFNTILRLSKKFGAERISRDAAIILSVHLAQELERLVKEADKYSRHAGRKTIMAEDVELAIQRK